MCVCVWERERERCLMFYAQSTAKSHIPGGERETHTLGVAPWTCLSQYGLYKSTVTFTHTHTHHHLHHQKQKSSRFLLCAYIIYYWISLHSFHSIFSPLTSGPISAFPPPISNICSTILDWEAVAEERPCYLKSWLYLHHYINYRLIPGTFAAAWRLKLDNIGI